MRKSIIALILVFVVCGWFSGNFTSYAQTPPQVQNISGWAWSSNVGWIAFGSWPNRVRLETATGNILGYAWNNNIGWIRLDPPGPYPAPPNYPANLAQHSTKITGPITGSPVTGWARACSVFLSGCSGALKSNIQLGGWDGWIKMSSDQTEPQSYGVAVGSSPGQSFPNSLYGEAWGGDVIGWIDFCPGDSGLPAQGCVLVDSLNVSCSGTPNPAILGSGPNDITWNLTVTGNYSSLSGMFYRVNVAGAIIPFESGNPITYAQSFTTLEPSVLPSDGKVTLDVEVFDSTLQPNTQYGHAICSVDVTAASPTKELSLNINGDGVVTSTGEVPNDPSGDINCNSNVGSCEDDYASNTLVTLTAVPASGSSFKGWTGDVPGCDPTGGTATCNVNMNQNRSVSATFWPTLTPPPIDANTLGVSSSIIKIDSHNSGLSVRSPSVKISNNTDEPLTFCVKEVISKVTDKGLNKDHSPTHASGTVLPATPIEQLVRCYFNNDDNSDKTCDYTDANGGVSISSVTLAPKGTVIGGNMSDTADFSIMVPVKLIEIKDNSPYGVRVGVCGDSGTYDKYIEFQYQPLTFEPQ